MTSSQQVYRQPHLLHYGQRPHVTSNDVDQLRLEAVAAVENAQKGTISYRHGIISEESQCASSHSQSSEATRSQSLSTDLRSQNQGNAASLSQTDSQETGPLQNDKDREWFTAQWRGVCPCALVIASPVAQYSPVNKPPTNLLALPSEGPHLDAQVGDRLLDWSEPSSPGVAFELQEFELQWKPSTSRPGPSGSVAQMLMARRPGYLSHDAQRKGKSRMADDEQSSAVTSTRSSSSTTLDGSVEEGQTGYGAGDPATATRKKRRKLHQEVLDGQGPSKLLEILPLPFSRPPLAPHVVHYMSIADSKVPDYGIRTPTDLPLLITRQPHTRVYWLIPVSGRVIVNYTEVHPSAGLITNRRPPKSSQKPEVMWTAHRLKQFWTDILQGVLQSTGRYGPIGLAASGPKPDPFRAEALYDDAVVAGDHLRVYCDLEWALKVRKFLEYVRIYDGTPQEGNAGLRGERVMKNAKLVLVGDLGEPLMVA